MHFISEKEVEQNLDMKEMISILEDVFKEYGEGTASSSIRERTVAGKISLNTMPAISEKLGLAGLKTMMASESGKRTTMVYLHDSKTSELIAAMEGHILSQIRTGALPAMVSRMLVKKRNPSFALIGSGHQAETQLSGMLAAFDVDDVRVYSRTFENAKKFAETEGSKHGIEIKPFSSAAEALTGADIITTITKSNEAIFSRKDLGEDYHVNLAGSNIPSRREVAGDVISESDLVVVEHLGEAMVESAEIIEASSNNPGIKIHELKDIMGKPELYSGKRRTVLKTMGIGLEDIAAGYLVLKKMNLI